MKKSGRISAVLLVICFLLPLLSAAASTPSGSEFTVANGVLIDYTGTDTDVVIPGDLGITEIGTNAFIGDAQLCSVTIPDGVIRIGEFAFYQCTGLESILIPDSVQSIGQSAFTECALYQVEIPSGIREIEDYTFWNCVNLSSLSIPDTVVSIGVYAFYGCSQLTDLTIPSGVRTIKHSAFQQCWNLSIVEIPETVTTVGTWAFANTSITEPIIVNYGKTLCYVPVSYESYVIPDSVTEIISAFSGCSILTDVTFPDGLTYIGDFAFNGCNCLTALSIPDSVTSVGTAAFISTGIENPVYINQGKTLCYLPEDTIEFHIPDSVEEIAGGAFMSCESLTTLTLPDSITTIGEFAFMFCRSLTSFDFPTRLKRVGSGAFEYCQSLTEVSIPGSLYSIGNEMFFMCTNLKIVQIAYGVNKIENNAFYGCESLSSLLIPESVYSIGMTAFSSCSSLTSLLIPDSVTEIHLDAFYRCFDLTLSAAEGSFVEEYAHRVGLNFNGLPAVETAAPAHAAFTLDTHPVSIEAVEIGGSNYVKLRDLAMLLTGTDKQFSVRWDEESHVITLSSGLAYEPVGGELNDPENSQTRSAGRTAADIILDGRRIGLTGFTIGDNNYFKLRNLAYYLDFGVTWNEASGLVEISTATGYTP